MLASRDACKRFPVELADAALFRCDVEPAADERGSRNFIFIRYGNRFAAVESQQVEVALKPNVFARLVDVPHLGEVAVAFRQRGHQTFINEASPVGVVVVVAEFLRSAGIDARRAFVDHQRAHRRVVADGA